MSWEYEELFDNEATEQPRIWQVMPTELKVGRMGYRTKTTMAGPRLEAEIYPVWGRETEARARAEKKNVSRVVVQRYNEERAKRYLVQLADANFGAEDISLTLTYNGAPPTYERAQKDVRAFLGKVRRRRAKAEMDPLKYIYTIEGDEDGNRKRIHIHMLINGGIAREELEALWGQGYANADRLQPDENGLEAIVRYITKQQRNRRKWAASKNLVKPKVRVSDTKTSNARVRRIAHDFQNEAREILEKLYPGYRFTKASVYYSDIVDGVYIRCVMRRMEERSRESTGYSMQERVRGQKRNMSPDL